MYFHSILNRVQPEEQGLPDGESKGDLIQIILGQIKHEILHFPV